MTTRRNELISKWGGDIRDDFLRKLVNAHYIHDRAEFRPGTFRNQGDTLDIFPAVEGYEGMAYRIEFWGDEVERISCVDPKDMHELSVLDAVQIYPANLLSPLRSRRSMR